MQKTFSILLIMIMMTLPMLSVSASIDSCQHPTPQSSDSILQVMNDMSDHDCCASPGVSCEHGGLCDCDNGQAAYSVVSRLQNAFPDYQKSSYKEVIPDLFISKSSDSLYRPPITIL